MLCSQTPLLAYDYTSISEEPQEEAQLPNEHSPTESPIQEIYEHISIAPLNTTFADSWATLREAVQSAVWPTTIEIVHDIILPAGADGNAITIPVGHDITLTGGHSIIRQAGTQRHFIVNGTLRLENVMLSGNYPIITANHGGIMVNAGGSLYMGEGSVIRNNRATNGAGVHVSGTNAQFIMDGGEISGNHAPAPTGSGGVGGVFVENAAVFIMNGGVIYNNSGRLGGGVRVGTSAAFPPNTDTRMYMYGGEIYNNTGSVGGGINIERGTFVLEYGTIRNNTATGIANTGLALAANRGGGGVFIQNDGIFNMNGGMIYDNHSHQRGGGVHVLGGVFTMTGGTISDNTAQNNIGLSPTHNTGGGVAVQDSSIFNMTGGSITDNTAIYDGGGIWLDVGTPTTGARLNMTGGSISNNVAGDDGGGIFASPTSTTNILPLTAYQNILAAGGSFYGNIAGGGQFAPPINAYTRPFGYLLTNYDINFRGPNQLVVFELNGGNVAGDTANILRTLPSGSAIGEINVPAPARASYNFVGWRYAGQQAETPNLTDAEVAGLTVSGQMTFTAQWVPQPREAAISINVIDISGNRIQNATVMFNGATVEPDASGYWIVSLAELMEGVATANADGFYPNSETVLLSDFTDYFAYVAIVLTKQSPSNGPNNNNPGNNIPGNNNLNSNTPNQAQPRPNPTNNMYPAQQELFPETEEFFHAGYMIGYPNGYVMPNGFITRAETAALLVRTMAGSVGVNPPILQTVNSINIFSDVAYDAWYHDYIAALYNLGFIQGYQDGSFKPDSHITHEEFAQMIARITATQTSSYGVSRPHELITRAEAALIMNRILGRGDTTVRSIENISSLVIFPDAANQNAPYFFDILEATNSHWFIKDGEEEMWTRAYQP